MKTDTMSWNDCSNGWYNKVDQVNVDPLYDALLASQSAMATVANAGDIGTLRLLLGMNEIEELNAKRRKLVSYCNGIHYEISQMVDTPFGVRTADLLEVAYHLNPVDYKVKTGTTLWWNDMTSLDELLKTTILDEQLKKNYESKIKALDKDKPSKELKDVLKEAEFWESEFEKSEQCQEIAAAVFTSEIRGSWVTMPTAEKKTVIEAYVNQISKVLFDESNTKVAYDSTGFGLSSEGTWWGIGRYISIAPKFINDSTENFSVDKVIDTLTHETRHQYQSMVTRSPNQYGIPKSLESEWNAPYIPSDKYALYYAQEVEQDARAFAALSSPEKGGEQ